MKTVRMQWSGNFAVIDAIMRHLGVRYSEQERDEYMMYYGALGTAFLVLCTYKTNKRLLTIRLHTDQNKPITSVNMFECQKIELVRCKNNLPRVCIQAVRDAWISRVSIDEHSFHEHSQPMPYPTSWPKAARA